MFSYGEFDYNQVADIYVCPASNALTYTALWRTMEQHRSVALASMQV